MILPLLKGLSITVRRLFMRKFTIQYPEQRKPMPERARWLHVLQRHEDGLERCVACMLCAAACPTEAIYIVGAENRPDHRVSHGERYPVVWDLDLGRCMFCGICVEVCPEEALAMSGRFELATYSRRGLVLHKEDLLAPEGTPPVWAWMGFYRREPEEKKPVQWPKEKHLRYWEYLRTRGREGGPPPGVPMYAEDTPAGGKQ